MGKRLCISGTFASPAKGGGGGGGGGMWREERRPVRQQKGKVWL